MKSIVLSPDGPFSELPRSDMLFGALCWGIDETLGTDRLESMLAEFQTGHPPFRISSAYPVTKTDTATIRYFPVPRLPWLVAGTGELSKEQLDTVATWKQIEFIPESLFSMIVQGSITSLEQMTGFDEDGHIDIGGQEYVRRSTVVLPADDGVDLPFRTAERTRNAVNRLTNATDEQLFQEEAVHFSKNSGLHICVDGELSLVRAGLIGAQVNGIGGNRSIGHGQFSIDGVDTITLPESTDPFGCTLSIAIPDDDAIESWLTAGFYELERRQGVIENDHTSPDSVWKRAVMALREGSLIPMSKDVHPGQNPIVGSIPAGDVQQYGYPLCVGIRGFDGGIHP